jgi:tRNA nucleotidyltransferase (CCA-adding enzyme)
MIKKRGRGRGKVMKTIEVLRKLDEETEASVYLVGGFVRDFLRGKPNKDLDIVVRNIDISKVLEFLKPYGRVEPIDLSATNGKFNMSILLFKASEDDEEAQITLARRGKDQIPHPKNTLTQDSKFRDFKINAMYLPVNFKSRKDVEDRHGGLKDIKNRIISAVGSAGERIIEQPIRIMRAFSLGARLNYRIDKKLEIAIREHSRKLDQIPVENIRDEFNKIILSKKPSKYLRWMAKLGTLEIILPELYNCIKVKQDRRFHKYDVFTHLIYTCDNIESTLVMRLAALLHDIGKPGTMKMVREKDGRTRVTFHKHEFLGAKLAKVLLTRMKYSNKIIEKVTNLISLHMYHYMSDVYRCPECKWNTVAVEELTECPQCSSELHLQVGWSDIAIRRFIIRAEIKKEDLNKLEELPLFKLRAAERLGNGLKTVAVTDRQRSFQDRIIDVYKRSHGLTIGDLDINGEIIMETFNMEESPKIGDILDFLLEKVLDHPPLNNRLDLLKLATEYLFANNFI